jgi:radical SAM superfamily enzyme with C-terminal helix-hairpin-helix motif
MVKKKFFKIIQKNIGLSLFHIDRLNPIEINAYIEKQNNKKIKITTEFPFVGRGNVLRDGIISHDKIDQEIDKILG